MNLRNRTILITGGTSGIGQELARQLLARGNKVIITGRDAQRIDDTKARLASMASSAMSLTLLPLQRCMPR